MSADKGIYRCASAAGTLAIRAGRLFDAKAGRLAFLRTSFWTAIRAGFDESGGSGSFNARMTYEPPNANWSLAVFGTNMGTSV